MAQTMTSVSRITLARSGVQRQSVYRSNRAVCLPGYAASSKRLSKFVIRAEGEKAVDQAKAAADEVQDGAKSAVEEAEAAFKEQANKANQAVSQKGVVEGTVKEPLTQGRPATDPNNAWDESIKEAGKNETEALGTQISIPDALRFRGVGPEHINSRLAMIGVTTGYLTKLITGKNTLDQYSAAPLPVILTFILFITASLIPITKGVTPDKAQQGIWTTKAEIYNGRLAMLGFISLIATDGWQWFSALQAAKGANL